MSTNARKISSKALTGDVRRGLTDAELQHAYGLTAEQLHSLLDRLVELGALEPREVRRRHASKNPEHGSRLREHAQKKLAEIPHPTDVEQSLWAHLLPVNGKVAQVLGKDFVFWAISCLGVIPLLITTLPGFGFQIATVALFFALLWGIVFKWLVVYHDESGWLRPIAAFFFTGVIGIPVLLAVYEVFLPGLSSLTESPAGSVRLIGYGLFVGVPEELCKIVPVFIYTFWRLRKGEEIDPPIAILIGIFSGLGFAGFENIFYALSSVDNAVKLTAEHGSDGAASGAAVAMIGIVVRSLSCVFCHAIWTGIFASFVVRGARSRIRWVTLVCAGLGVSAGLHGVYDWFVGDHMVMASVTAGFSFMIFYAYLAKIETGMVGETLRPGLPFFD